MIQAITTPQQQAEYRRRIAGKPYFESVLGTHLALFGAHPASGWMFYLLPGTDPVDEGTLQAAGAQALAGARTAMASIAQLQSKRRISPPPEWTVDAS